MRLCPAADDGDAIDMRAAIGQRIHAVAEGKGDAFEHGLANGGGIAFMGQAKQHALGIGIIMRRAFARQIGQEDFARCRARRALRWRQTSRQHPSCRTA